MFRTVLDLLLPERCAACGALGRGLCAGCLRAAAALRTPDAGLVHLDPGVLALAPFVYDGVIATAIRAVKAPGRHGPAVHLGELLWAEMAPRLGPAAAWPRTWVPSTRARLRARGAEIPRLLAGGGAYAMLRRLRQAADQKVRSGVERRRGPWGDFRPVGSIPDGVVMVDDVRTTGTTARAAAAALKAGGAARVLVITLSAVRDTNGISTHSRRQAYDAYNASGRNPH